MAKKATAYKKPKKTTRYQKTREKKYPLSYLIPIIAIIAVIPLIVRYYYYETGMSGYDWYQGSQQALDFFLHCKMVWLLITLGAILLMLCYMVFSAEINLIWTRNLIPLAVYCSLTLLSAFFSIDKSFSFSGSYEQFEPVWILMGYFLIVYYAFYNLHTESAVKRLLPWFVAGVAIMCLIGLSQVFSCDIFRTDFIKNFILPSNVRNLNLTFKFEEGRSYLTLYNPNYVGFYVALVVPILIALLFHTKKILYIIGYGVLTACMLLILFSSQSRAGIIALILSLIVMLLCMRKVIFKNLKITAAAAVVAIVAFTGFNIMNQGVLLDRMKNMFSTEEENHPLESILTDKDVAITYNQNTIHFAMQREDSSIRLLVTDDSGAKIAYTTAEDDSENSITDERFPFTFALVLPDSDSNDSLTGFQVTIDGKTWTFTDTSKTGKSDGYYVKGLGNSLFQLTTQEESLDFLEKHYSFANNRGYIWARTLPLLKKYFFFGTGPDTFVLAFPNDDLVGLYNSGHDNEIITRPHCLYLQIAVQTGVPSLIAFLIFFGWYIISSLRIYWKADYSELLPKIGVSVLTSVIGYLILGLTNDSCITTSPIFFALTGMGLGINYYLKNNQFSLSKTR